MCNSKMIFIYLALQEKIKLTCQGPCIGKISWKTRFNGAVRTSLGFALPQTGLCSESSTGEGQSILRHKKFSLFLSSNAPLREHPTLVL